MNHNHNRSLPNVSVGEEDVIKVFECRNGLAPTRAVELEEWIIARTGLFTVLNKMTIVDDGYLCGSYRSQYRVLLDDWRTRVQATDRVDACGFLIVLVSPYTTRLRTVVVTSYRYRQD